MGQKKSPPKEPARDRILRCATARFSTQSYETTGLREIAADAGADVAWVHRCFGSKEKLFEECVRVSLASDTVLSDVEPDKFDRLFEQVVRNRAPGELRLIDIFVRSLSSPEAATVIRDITNSMVVPPLVKAAGQGSEAKVALTLSMLFGFAILRDVVGLDALRNAEPNVMKRLLMNACEIN
jgi:AcrR family transcriptional regulator